MYSPLGYTTPLLTSPAYFSYCDATYPNYATAASAAPTYPTLPICDLLNAPFFSCFTPPLRSQSTPPPHHPAVMSDTSEDSDDDVMLIEPPKPKVAVATAAASGTGAGTSVGGSDDEIEVTGQAGTGAARDMPHPRSMCAKHPFQSATNSQKENDTCDQCYCYVCDTLISLCNSWSASPAPKPKSSYHCIETLRCVDQNNIAQSILYCVGLPP